MHDTEDTGDVALPIDGTLDLHTFPAREAWAVTEAYLDEARRVGVLHVRIVHGKGTGSLQRTIHARLARRADVVSYKLADGQGGGWGATVVELRPIEG